jgi:VWFA-related protein
VLALCGGEVARAQFATSVQAVEVYATVTRADGLAVPDLVQPDFEILEDGVRQPISVFAAGEFPLIVALGVDRSLSMRGEPLRLAIRASQAFLRVLRPADRSMVWAIADGAEVIAPLDQPREAQIAAVAALFPWSTTALYDGVVAALDRLDPEPGRQAVVLFTDGADRYSTATAGAVLDRARRSRALVYSVAVGKTRPPLLAELASVSGGRFIEVHRMEGLEGALAAVASELRGQYLLGYVPERRPGGHGRTVALHLRSADGPARPGAGRPAGPRADGLSGAMMAGTEEPFPQPKRQIGQPWPCRCAVAQGK